MGSDVQGWLVIEDELPLLKNLNQFVPATAKLPSARILEQAQNILVACPLRVVSFDLNLPDASGSTHTSLGRDLLEKKRLPLARTLVYTGYRSTEDGMSAIFLGGESGFWVLAKGARNVVQGRVATATPLGWCALMLHLLGQDLPDVWGGLKAEAEQFMKDLKQANRQATEPWQRSYWRQAKHHLPQPLAQAAERYAATVTVSGRDVMLGRDGLLALNDLRDWVLWLAAAQTAVIARQHATLPNGVVQGDGLRAAHLWISRQLRTLHALPPQVAGAVSWRNHLGCYVRPASAGGSVSVESTALDALEDLRKVRNEGVHGLKPKDKLESELSMLPPIMDLAAFWANNPLLTQVRREGGRWRAKALCGKEPADFELPEDLQLPSRGVHADYNRVYQLVWRFSGDGPAEGDPWRGLGQATPVLLDWWPYLRLAFNSELGRAEPLLLTFADHAGARRWHAQGFSGTLRKPELTAEEVSALLQPPA